MLVAGPTGAGKTTFAKAAADSETTILSLDRYLIPPEPGSGLDANRSIPAVWDSDWIVADVAAMVALPAGARYSVPVYDFKQSKRAGFEVLEIKRRLVVEGVYALLHLPNLETPFKVFVDAPLDVLKQRKIKRDRDRGRTLEEILQRLHQYVIPAIQKYVLPQKTAATYLVYNALQPSENLIEAPSAALPPKLSPLNPPGA